MVSARRPAPVRAGSIREQHGRLVSVADAALPRERPRVVERRGRLVLTRAKSKAPGVSVEAPTPTSSAAVWEVVGGGQAALIGLVVISMLIPAAQNVGSLRLTPSLILLTIATVPMIGLWLGGRAGRFILADWLMLAYCLWATLALVAASGIVEALQPAGVVFLQTFSAYLAGRLLIRGPAAFKLLFRLAAIAAMVVVPALLVETLTGVKVMLKIGSLFGSALPEIIKEKRLGLVRAQGAFEHPILMGVYYATLLGPSYYVFHKNRPTIFGIISSIIVIMCAICSVSTGALLSFNVQLALMAWSRLLRVVSNRWRLLTILLILAYLGLDMVTTRSPFHTFVRYATFDFNASYNRILIWQYGSAEAIRHPFFGIGLGDWKRPEFMSNSMDNFWLVTAVRYGMPALAILVCSIIAVLARAGRIDYEDGRLTLMRRGITFGLVATMIAICSVHLWNATYTWLIFLIGSAAWLGDARWGRAKANGKSRGF